MWNAIATYNLEIGKHRGDAMVGMELNREDDINFSGYKEDYSILTPDYMWPNAGSVRLRLTVRAKAIHWFLSSEN